MISKGGEGEEKEKETDLLDMCGVLACKRDSGCCHDLLYKRGGGLLCFICSIYILIYCGFACCMVCRREKRLTEMKPLSHWRNGQGNRYVCCALYDEAVLLLYKRFWGWILR